MVAYFNAKVPDYESTALEFAVKSHRDATHVKLSINDRKVLQQLTILEEIINVNSSVDEDSEGVFVLLYLYDCPCCCLQHGMWLCHLQSSSVSSILRK